MRNRKMSSNKTRISDCLKQMENMASVITLEKPMERIRTLEEKINEVTKIQDIEESIRQLKNHLWTTKEVLSSSEVCEFLGISESYLYRLTSSKQIPYYKPNGKMIFFNRKELCEWAMRNPEQVNEVSTSPNKTSL